MPAAEDRIQDALAAHLDYLEMGGTPPDTSHLSAAEKRELNELIDALAQTEGVAFGRGRAEDEAPTEAVPDTAEGRDLLEQLKSALPPGIRIETDANRLVVQIGGVAILDRWLLGTFGGRVRVWLLSVASAAEVERNQECLVDLARVFRMFPDMSAIALVGTDSSCLIVEPEDTSPQIQVPSGSLVGRRYRRTIQPAIEALPSFLDELVPLWDPMPAFDPDSGLRIDVSEITDDFVRSAIDRQRGIGERARKGNPKKDALLGLGLKETNLLLGLAKGLFDGSVAPEEVTDKIERWAGRS